MRGAQTPRMLQSCAAAVGGARLMRTVSMHSVEGAVTVWVRAKKVQQFSIAKLIR
jgi:hypothetical protein